MNVDFADLLCCDGRQKTNEHDDDSYDLETVGTEIPFTLRKLVEQSMNLFLSMKETGNWILSKQADGVTVSYCSYPKRDFYFWKVEVTPIYGPRDAIFE